MKKIIFLLIACFASLVAFSQIRYVDSIFSSVSVDTGITYGSNISQWKKLAGTGPGEIIDLKMDIYRPAGDTVTARPLIIYIHGGFLMPVIQNGKATGSRKDSSVVEMCKQFAKKGYVAAAITYRCGWNPFSQDQNVRTSTWIRGIYRGIQDTRTAIRWFRKNIATNGNIYGIDGNNVIVCGEEYGGIIALSASALDKQSEVEITKFLDFSSGIGIPAINPDSLGDVWGFGGIVDTANSKGGNVENHVGYPSDISLAISMGGAIPDSMWIEQGEAGIIGTHGPLSNFLPYETGAVIVPSFQYYVVDVSGTAAVVASANSRGNNTAINAQNLNDPYTMHANSMNNGVDNLYPLYRPNGEGAPWEWWNQNDVPTAVNNASLSSNPDMSKAKALRYIDTLQHYFAPRINAALGFSGAPCLQLTANTVQPTCGNADGEIAITVSGGTGAISFAWSSGGTTSTLSNLAPGIYIVTVQDAGSCSVSDTIVLSNAGAPVVTYITAPTCSNAQTGSIDLTVSGGSAPYAFEWNTGESTQNLLNLSPGTYTVTVTDDGNCVVLAQITVAAVTLPITFTSVVSAGCAQSDGSVVAIASGTPPYTYAWSNGATSDALNNASAGGYSVSVTDAAGCTGHANIVIPSAPACFGLVKGTVYADNNNNCIQDIGEPGLANVMVDFSPGGGAYTDADGHYNYYAVPGTYTITQRSAFAAFQGCPPTAQTIAVAGNDTIEINIGDTIGNITDLQVILVSSTARPGFIQGHDIVVKNNSSQTVNPELTFALDSVVYSSALYGTAPTTLNAVTRTAEWQLPAMQPFTSTTIHINVLIPVIPDVSLGQVLDYVAEVTSSFTDIYPNNVSEQHSIISGAFDPNDKAVSVNGWNVDQTFVPVVQQPFDYHIRFQNTGTDTAFTVVIRDTLDNDLDYSTFVMNASSHPCVVSFEQDNIVLFTFANILLPDSNVNQPASHGFVNFSIRAFDNAIGNQVENQAGIYFDFNPPVMTNRVSTAYMVGVSEVAEQLIQAYPNPSTDNVRIKAGNKQFNNLTIHDIYGREITATGNELVNYTDISVKDLSVGIYLIKLNVNGKWVSGRIAVVR